MEQLFAVRVLVHYHDKSNVDHAAVRRLISAAAVDNLQLLLSDGTTAALSSYIHTNLTDRKAIVDVLGPTTSSLTQVAAIFMLAEARAAADALPSSPHELEAACSALERLLGCLATKRPLLPVLDIKQSARVKFGTAARRRAVQRLSRPDANPSDPEVSILKAVNAILRLCDVATHCLAVVSRQSVSSRSSCETAVALSTRLLTLAASLYEVQKADPNPALSFFSSNSLRTALVAGAMHLGSITIEHNGIEPMTWVHVANRIVMSSSTSVVPKTSVLSALFGGMLKAGRQYETTERDSKAAEGAICLLSTLHVVLETDAVREFSSGEPVVHKKQSRGASREDMTPSDAPASLALSSGAISQAARSFLGERVVAAEEDGDEGRIAARTVYQACEEYAARAGEADGMLGFLARIFAAAGKHCRLESTDDSVVSVSEGTMACQPEESDASSDGAHTRPDSPPFAVDVFDQRSKDGFGASATVGSSSEMGGENSERVDLHREIGALALDTLAHCISKAQNLSRYSDIDLAAFVVDICKSASHFTLSNSSASYDLRAGMVDFGTLIGPKLLYELGDVSLSAGASKWASLTGTLIKTCDRTNPVLQSIISITETGVVRTLLDAFLSRHSQAESTNETGAEASSGLPLEDILQMLIRHISPETGLEVVKVLVDKVKGSMGQEVTESAMSHHVSLLVLLTHAVQVSIGLRSSSHEARICFSSLYNKDSSNMFDPMYPSYAAESQSIEIQCATTARATEVVRALLPILQDVPQIMDVLFSQSVGQTWEQLSASSTGMQDSSAGSNLPDNTNRKQEKTRYHVLWACAMFQKTFSSLIKTLGRSHESVFPFNEESTRLPLSAPFVCMKSLKSRALSDIVRRSLEKRRHSSFSFLYTAECLGLIYMRTTNEHRKKISAQNEDFTMLLNSIVSNVVSIGEDWIHTDMTDNFRCLQRSFRKDTKIDAKMESGDAVNPRLQFHSGIAPEQISLACLHLAMGYSRDIGTGQISRLLALVMGTATEMLKYLTEEQAHGIRDILFLVAELLPFLPDSFYSFKRSLSSFFVTLANIVFPDFGEEGSPGVELLKFTSRVCGLRKLAQLGSLSPKTMHLFCQFAGEISTGSIYSTDVLDASLSTGIAPVHFGPSASKWLVTLKPSVRLKEIVAMLLVPNDESAVAVSTHAQSLSSLTSACASSNYWCDAVLTAIQECLLDEDDTFAIRMVRRSIMHSATMNESVLSLFDKLVANSRTVIAPEILQSVFSACCDLFESEKDASVDCRIRLLRFAVCLAISYGRISHEGKTKRPRSLLVPTLFKVVVNALEGMTNSFETTLEHTPRKQVILLLCNLVDCYLLGLDSDRRSYFTCGSKTGNVLSGADENCDSEKREGDSKDQSSKGDAEACVQSEDPLKSPLCTYTSTGSQFVEQHWYVCYTCELAGSEGVCSVCARNCHQGCELAYSKFSRFFCDCGAGSDPQQENAQHPMSASDDGDGGDGDGGNGNSQDTASQPLSSIQARKRKTCKSLKPERPKESSPVNSQTRSEHKPGPGVSGRDNDTFLDDALRKELISEIRAAFRAREGTEDKELSNLEREFSSLLTSSKTVSSLIKASLFLVKDLDCSWSARHEFEITEASGSGAFHTLQSLLKDPSCVKVPKTETISQCVRVLKSGALEVVKGSSRDRVKSSQASCISFSPSRTILAVAQQSGNIDFIDASNIMRSTGTQVEKRSSSEYCRVSVPFGINGIRFHPENRNILLVVGAEKICVLSRIEDSSGCRWEQIEIELGLKEFDGYDGYNALLDADWINDGPAFVLVTTAKFIKIFDVAVDTFCPQLYATLPPGVASHSAGLPADGRGDEGFVNPKLSSIAGAVAVSLHGEAQLKSSVYVFVVTTENELFISGQGKSDVFDSGLKYLCNVSDGNESQSKVVGLCYHPAESLLVVVFESGNLQCMSLYGKSLGEDNAPIARWVQVYKDALPGGSDIIIRPVHGERAYFMFSRVGDTLQASGSLALSQDKVMTIQWFTGNPSASVAGIAPFGSSPYLGEPTSAGGLILLDDGSLYRATTVEECPRMQVSEESVFSSIAERRSLRTFHSSHLGEDIRQGYNPVPEAVGFFEKCRLVADQMSIEGCNDWNDNGPKLERMSVTLAGGGDGCVVSPKENEPFKFSVRIDNRAIVLVGARLRFGGTDRSRNLVPAEVKVFGRLVKWRSRNGVKRWLDIPFTVPESMESPQRVTFELFPRRSMGDGSVLGEGLLAIDSLDLYAVSNIEFTERKLLYETEKTRHYEQIAKRRESSEYDNSTKTRNQFRVTKRPSPGIGANYSCNLEQAGLLTLVSAIDSKTFADDGASDALVLEINNLWSAQFEESLARNPVFLEYLLKPCLRLCSDNPSNGKGGDVSPKARDLLTSASRALGKRISGEGMPLRSDVIERALFALGGLCRSFLMAGPSTVDERLEDWVTNFVRSTLNLSSVFPLLEAHLSTEASGRAHYKSVFAACVNFVDITLAYDTFERLSAAGASEHGGNFMWYLVRMLCSLNQSLRIFAAQRILEVLDSPVSAAEVAGSPFESLVANSLLPTLGQTNTKQDPSAILSDEANGNEDSESTQRWAYRCDSCGEVCEQEWWHCNDCEDFDLCTSCLRRDDLSVEGSHQGNHLLLRGTANDDMYEQEADEEEKHIPKFVHSVQEALIPLMDQFLKHVAEETDFRRSWRFLDGAETIGQLIGHKGPVELRRVRLDALFSSSYPRVLIDQMNVLVSEFTDVTTCEELSRLSSRNSESFFTMLRILIHGSGGITAALVHKHGIPLKLCQLLQSMHPKLQLLTRGISSGYSPSKVTTASDSLMSWPVWNAMNPGLQYDILSHRVQSLHTRASQNLSVMIHVVDELGYMESVFLNLLIATLEVLEYSYKSAYSEGIAQQMKDVPRNVLCDIINFCESTHSYLQEPALFKEVSVAATRLLSVLSFDDLNTLHETLDKYLYEEQSVRLETIVRERRECESNVSEYDSAVEIASVTSSLHKAASRHPETWRRFAMDHETVLENIFAVVQRWDGQVRVNALQLLGAGISFSSDLASKILKGKAIVDLEEGKGKNSGNFNSMQESDDVLVKSDENKGLIPPAGFIELGKTGQQVGLGIFREQDFEMFRFLVQQVMLRSQSKSARKAASQILMIAIARGAGQTEEQFVTPLHSAMMKGLQLMPFAGDLADGMVDCMKFFILCCQRDLFGAQSESFLGTLALSISSLLKVRCGLLISHPNARLYGRLGGILEMNGYFLESDPCMTCSASICDSSEQKEHRLDTIRAETKYTDCSIMHRLLSVHEVQAISVKIIDPRRSRRAKTIDVLYSSRTVTDAADLKSSDHPWRKLRALELSPSATEARLDLTVPIAAANIKLEFVDFHTFSSSSGSSRSGRQSDRAAFSGNGSGGRRGGTSNGSNDNLQCPRCSRSVADRHGICRNCHENAYQCRQCRNINYENLDGFLCNECGYCKHGRFEFSITGRTTFVAERISSEEDRKRASKVIEKETGNVHRCMEQLTRLRSSIIRSLNAELSSDDIKEKPKLFGTTRLGLSDFLDSVAPRSDIAVLEALLEGQASHDIEEVANSGHGISVTEEVVAESSGSADPSEREQNNPTGSNLASPVNPSGRNDSRVSQPDSMVINKSTSVMANTYSKECRSIYSTMSRGIRILTLTRAELVRYANTVGGSRLDYAKDITIDRDGTSLTSESTLPDPESSAETSYSPKRTCCYGCTQSFISKCVLLLQTIMKWNSPAASAIQNSNLAKEMILVCSLCEKRSIRNDIRDLISFLVNDNLHSTQLVCTELARKIEFCVDSFETVDAHSVARFEMGILEAISTLDDSCWEERLRLVVRILFKSSSYALTCSSIAESIILPCLRVALRLMRADSDLTVVEGQSAGGACGNTEVASNEALHLQRSENSETENDDVENAVPDQIVAVARERGGDQNQSRSESRSAIDQVDNESPNSLPPMTGIANGTRLGSNPNVSNYHSTPGIEERRLVDLVSESGAPSSIGIAFDGQMSDDEGHIRSQQSEAGIDINAINQLLENDHDSKLLTADVEQWLEGKVDQTSWIAEMKIRFAKFELKEKASSQGEDLLSLNPLRTAFSKWKGLCKSGGMRLYEDSSILEEEQLRKRRLSIEKDNWIVRLMLFTPCPTVRKEACSLLELTCGQEEALQLQLLDVLTGPALSLAADVGEKSKEFFDLLETTLVSSNHCLYLIATGFLPKLATIIQKRAERLFLVEANAASSMELVNLLEGYSLKRLLALLRQTLEAIPSQRMALRQKLFEVDDNKLVWSLERAYICVRKLISLRTKLTDECGSQLCEVLMSKDFLFTGPIVHAVISACVAELKAARLRNDAQAIAILLEQLCQMLCPERKEPVCYLALNKAPTQEEFIRGSMSRNPYPSSAFDGPLMRDVKNKICRDLDLPGLLEDDFGMELLVAGNLIKLDLPIMSVYEHVWRGSTAASMASTLQPNQVTRTFGLRRAPHSHARVAGSSSSTGAMRSTLLTFRRITTERDSSEEEAKADSRVDPPMVVVYRLSGLDGEATEPIVETVPVEAEDEQDAEELYGDTIVFGEVGGLDVLFELLAILGSWGDDAETAVRAPALRLLRASCEVAQNRALLAKSKNAVRTLLDCAASAFEHAQGSPTAVTSAESLLIAAEQILAQQRKEPESNSKSVPDSVNVSSHDPEEVISRVKMFLGRLSVATTPKAENSILHLLPFLIHGVPTAIDVVLEQFSFSWDKLDDNEEEQGRTRQLGTVLLATPHDLRGDAFAEQIIRTNIAQRAVEYVIRRFPIPRREHRAEWDSAVNSPGPPLVLRLITGLSLFFTVGEEQQRSSLLFRDILKNEAKIIPVLCQLEMAVSDNSVGTAAEELLDALSRDQNIMLEIEEERASIKKMRKNAAEASRLAILRETGLGGSIQEVEAEKVTPDKPSEGDPLNSLSVMQLMEDLPDEVGPACVVCGDGFRCRPEDTLAFYVYCRKVPLDLSANHSTGTGKTVTEGLLSSLQATARLDMEVWPSGRSRSSNSGPPKSGANSCYTTVTHLNAIHLACHKEAARVDRTSRRDEWDGASLRNSQTRCNNLFPVRPPILFKEKLDAGEEPIAKSARLSYSSAVDSFFGRLSSLGRTSLSHAKIVTYDLGRCLLKFADGRTGVFSEHAKGGGPHSNACLIPHLVQLAIYLIEVSPQKVNNKKLFVNNSSLQTQEAALVKFLDEDETGDMTYYLSSAFVLQSLSQWRSSIVSFLRRGLREKVVPKPVLYRLITFCDLVNCEMKRDVSTTEDQHWLDSLRKHIGSDETFAQTFGDAVNDKWEEYVRNVSDDASFLQALLRNSGLSEDRELSLVGELLAKEGD